MYDELRCSFCDTLVPRGATACPTCGAPVHTLLQHPPDADLPPPDFDTAGEVVADPDSEPPSVT